MLNHCIIIDRNGTAVTSFHVSWATKEQRAATFDKWCFEALHFENGRQATIFENPIDPHEYVVVERLPDRDPAHNAMVSRVNSEGETLECARIATVYGLWDVMGIFLEMW